MVTMAMALAEEIDSEWPVIEAIQSGDRQAFEELLRRHDRWVRGIILGVLGHSDALDDVSQQVWSAVWRTINELRDVKKWRSWLYRLSRNAAYDAGREATRRRNHQKAHASNLVHWDDSTTDDDVTLKDEKHRIVLEAIQILPALYREPFILKHVNGWTYKQIAEVMDMPVDSVETRLVRARRLLRESLKDRLD